MSQGEQARHQAAAVSWLHELSSRDRRALPPHAGCDAYTPHVATLALLIPKADASISAWPPTTPPVRALAAVGATCASAAPGLTATARSAPRRGTPTAPAPGAPRARRASQTSTMMTWRSTRRRRAVSAAAGVERVGIGVWLGAGWGLAGGSACVHTAAGPACCRSRRGCRAAACNRPGPAAWHHCRGGGRPAAPGEAAALQGGPQAALQHAGAAGAVSGCGGGRAGRAAWACASKQAGGVLVQATSGRQAAASAHSRMVRDCLPMPLPPAPPGRES